MGWCKSLAHTSPFAFNLHFFPLGYLSNVSAIKSCLYVAVAKCCLECEEQRGCPDPGILEAG